jgi:phosphoglycerol transferase MdoB-like AlkP superfamily enzyme
MERPFISSVFSANQIESLPGHLKKMGYTTSFYHGGMNGTMNFDGYCRSAGIDAYFGRKEYGLQKDYDGAWGIYDGPFFYYWAQHIESETSPFFSCFFSLSSHHPYPVPKDFEAKLNPEWTPLEKSIAYADDCLGTFIKTFQKSKHFNNTLIVLTADHTADSRDVCYGGKIGQLAIPLVFYAPQNILPGHEEKTAQQIDIMPTILDFLGFPDTVFSFGNALFRPQPSGSISYAGGGYTWIDDKVVIGFAPGTPPLFYLVSDTCGISKPLDETSEYNPSFEKLKAFIQTYQMALTQNKMTCQNRR